jgi:hypothetical protein
MKDLRGGIANCPGRFSSISGLSPRGSAGRLPSLLFDLLSSATSCARLRHRSRSARVSELRRRWLDEAAVVREALEGFARELDRIANQP